MLLISVVIALAFGLLLTMGKLSRNKIVRAVCTVYISFMRGTPMMVQVLLVFILIPLIAFQNGANIGSWNNIIYAIIAFTLNEAAFYAEIFRSAYNSLDRGQIEAALSLGMSRMQVFTRVILPQGAASALPNTTNMTIELMKNTSIASVIGIYDLLGQAQQLAKNSYGVGQIQLYIFVALMYWVIGLIILSISNFATNRLNKGNAAYKKVSIFAVRS